MYSHREEDPFPMSVSLKEGTSSCRFVDKIRPLSLCKTVNLRAKLAHTVQRRRCKERKRGEGSLSSRSSF